jgi:hypothetical protein
MIVTIWREVFERTDKRLVSLGVIGEWGFKEWMWEGGFGDVIGGWLCDAGRRRIVTGFRGSGGGHSGNETLVE